MERAQGICYNAIRYDVGKEKECGMRFQEEVISKIMTYFTVILLLGILIFEAWSLQRERASRREAEASATAAYDRLDEMSGQNERLKEENEGLHARLDEWEPYLSLAEDDEMTSLKRELFSHPALIPDQAAEALAAEISGEEEADSDGEDSRKGDSEAEETGEAKQELEFEFHKDGGEPVFFPLSTQVVDADNCLIYTVAYEKTSGRRLGLLYEVDLERVRREALEEETAGTDGEAQGEDGAAEPSETPGSSESAEAQEESGEETGEGPAEEIPGAWTCVAYNTGSGWNGVEENGEQER